MSEAEIEAHLEEISRIAPEGYNIGFHVRYSRPALTKLTYDPEWSLFYSAQKFILCDPVVIWALTHSGATRWSDIDLPDTLGVMAAAARYGYRFGVAIGHGDLASKTIGSCGRGDREFTDAEIDDLVRHVGCIHALLEKTSGLKEHHLEALRMLEAGYTYDEGCERLGISRTAFRARLSVARDKLGAKNNAEAVRLAVEMGLLTSTSYLGVTKALPVDGEAVV